MGSSRPKQVCLPNCISLGFAVFAGFTVMTNTQTEDAEMYRVSTQGGRFILNTSTVSRLSLLDGGDLLGFYPVGRPTDDDRDGPLVAEVVVRQHVE